MTGAGLVLLLVQATGEDVVVKTPGWDGATSTLRVPARTMAISVRR